MTNWVKSQTEYAQNSADLIDKTASFARAYEPLDISAKFKSSAADFIVKEVLPFELTGEGEHTWLYIEKYGCNTQWVARKLADFAKVRLRDIGYAGMKDRHGMTSQWFSVHLPGKEGPDWSRLVYRADNEGFTILQTRRHYRKLKRGALKFNRFHIVLRFASAQVMDEMMRCQLQQRCQLISQKGVPNYFGEQRFGRQRSNLESASLMLGRSSMRPGRDQKSIYLSAARSWIFNQILSQRVKEGDWDKRRTGDVFMLEGKSACFKDDQSDDLSDRLLKGEIHPTAVLWGEGKLMTCELVAEMEMEHVNAFPVFRDGLVRFRVEQRRRALRLMPRNMEWKLNNAQFTVSFELPSGAFATAVLNELVELKTHEFDEIV